MTPGLRFPGQNCRKTRKNAADPQGPPKKRGIYARRPLSQCRRRPGRSAARTAHGGLKASRFKLLARFGSPQRRTACDSGLFSRIPRRSAREAVAPPRTPAYNPALGEVPEWSIGTVSKTVVRASVPWVRIPPSPPVPLSSLALNGALRVTWQANGCPSHDNEMSGAQLSRNPELTRPVRSDTSQDRAKIASSVIRQSTSALLSRAPARRCMVRIRTIERQGDAGSSNSAVARSLRVALFVQKEFVAYRLPKSPGCWRMCTNTQMVLQPDHFGQARGHWLLFAGKGGRPRRRAHPTGRTSRNLTPGAVSVAVKSDNSHPATLAFPPNE
jgi:hypothetical protein